MRISADATEGAAMDDTINVTTADARAPAKASCHFIGHPLPFNRKRPCSGIMARLRGYVKFIRKRSRSFLLFLFASPLRFMTRVNAHLARGTSSRPCADGGKKGCYKEPTIRDAEAEPAMARDFEDHCWKDVIDADTIAIYKAYRRQTYVGDNPAVLAIDLYNRAYLGGNRPVREVDREFSGSCGEHAWKALPLTQKLFAAARRARVPVIYTTRHVDTGGVQSTNRTMGRQRDDVYG